MLLAFEAFFSRTKTIFVLASRPCRTFLFRVKKALGWWVILNMVPQNKFFLDIEKVSLVLLGDEVCEADLFGFLALEQ